ncbi:MAG: cobalt ECF transporter T component CbiQ [Phycisphaerae bacterium]|jgi:cobalt/nickel transport system permease protein
MHHHHLDRFAHLDSPVHRLDARAKFLAAVAYTVTVISFDRYAVGVLAPLAIGPVVLLWLGGVPLGFALRRAAILCPFIATLALFSPLYDRLPHAVAFGPWAFQIAGGWLTAADVTLKFTLGVLALTALVATTPFALLLEALRRMGTPRMLVVQLGFLYRYIFVLIDEAMRTRRARDFRGAAAAPAGRRLAATGGVIASLFVRTLDRSDRIHAAMLARGYQGEPHSLSRLRFTLTDAAFLILAAAYLAACRWVWPAMLWRIF